MKMGKAIAVVGITMFVLGLIMFYSIESSNTEGIGFIKNVGTFIGLSGMGVTLAGILLHLISRGEPPIKENLDV